METTNSSFIEKGYPPPLPSYTTQLLFHLFINAAIGTDWNLVFWDNALYNKKKARKKNSLYFSQGCQ